MKSEEAIEIGTSGRFLRFAGDRVSFEGRDIGTLVREPSEFEESYRFEPAVGRVNHLAGTLDDALWMIAEGVRKELLAAGELLGREHEPWRVAIHEAGHAVAAVKLRTGLRTASIVQDDQSFGRVSGATLLRGKSGGTSPTMFRQERIERQIVVLLSGYAAEEKEFGNSAEFDGAEQDYQNAFELAGSFVGSQEECNEYIGQLSLRADQLVGDHWSAIKAVAQALLKHQELTRSEVLRLIESSR